MTLLFRATIHYRTCLQRMIYCLHSKVSEANQRLKAWSFFRFATTIRFWRQSPPECCLGRLKTRVVRIYFQTWDWSDKSPVYKVTLFILCEIGPGWETKSFVTTYRAWLRDEMSV